MLLNDYDVRFVLDHHSYFDLYSVSTLKKHSTGRHVAPFGHIILIPSQHIFPLAPEIVCLVGISL